MTECTQVLLCGASWGQGTGLGAMYYVCTLRDGIVHGVQLNVDVMVPATDTA